MNDTVIEVGYIAGAHGIRGEVKVKLYNPESTILFDEENFILRAPKGSTQKVTIHAIREGSKCFLVAFKGVMNRNRAEELKGDAILVETPPEDGDEVYLEALRGYHVQDEVHGPLGKIQSFMLTSLDILVVRDDDRNEALVPLLPDTIVEINHEEKQLTVRTPEGLIGEE